MIRVETEACDWKNGKAVVLARIRFSAIMSYKQYDIRVVDTAVDPSSDQKIISYRKGDKFPLYRVWIYLEGRDLPFVKRVTYQLHPTFNPREITVDRSAANPKCQIEIWSWGVFEIKAIVELKTEDLLELTHQLSYPREFAGAHSRELQPR
jgi:hypothetical protein